MSDDGTIRVWRLDGGEEWLDTHSDGGVYTAVTFSHDGRRLLAADTLGSVVAWSRQGRSWRPEGHVVHHRAAVGATAVSARNDAATGDASGGIAVWNERLELTAAAGVARHGIDTIAFSPDGGLLAASDGSDSATLWNLATGELREFDAGAPIVALAFPHDGHELMFTRTDGAIGRWNLEGGDHAPLSFHRGRDEATAAVVLHSIDAVVSSHPDGTVRRTSMADGGLSRVLGHHPHNVDSLAVSPDMALVAAGGRDGEIRLWRFTGSESLDDKVEWLTDAPVDRDQLGRAGLAHALGRRLARVAEDGGAESFLMHVDGPWGAGKSSILALIKKELDEKWLAVDFDAWRQSRVGPPWWALLTSLRAALRRDLRWRARVRLRMAEIGQRLRRHRVSYALLGVLAAAAIAVYVLVAPGGGGSGSARLQILSGAIALITTLWLLASATAQSLIWESATAARLYEQSHNDPMERLAEHFCWLMGRAGKRVIFFVDDLDRCSEEYVVDLLDSIQTLVRDRRPAITVSGNAALAPYFVIAADGRWIRCSYEHAYTSFEEAVREPGRPLGYLFLDKIFQLTVKVPDIGSDQRTQFLGDLLRKATAPSQMVPAPLLAQHRERIRRSVTQSEVLEAVRNAPADARPGLRNTAIDKLHEPVVELATEHELEKFAALLEPNPRSMKRFVNAYSMALSTALLEDRLPNPDALALWTILRMRWPDLADLLSGDPALISDIAGGQEPELDGPPWLSGLVRHDAVAGVATFGGGVLDERAISALCGAERRAP